MKQVLGLGIAIMALTASSANAQERLERSCRREIIQMCGMTFDRDRLKTCVREKVGQLSADCQMSLLKRIAARAEAKQGPNGATEMSYGTDPKQKLDFWPAASRASRPPLVVFVHGGGWSIGDKKSGTGEKAAHFTKLGFAFASLNYRLVPTTDPAGQASDIANALAYLRGQAAQLGFDPDRIVIMGHSAGAHLVALVSSDERYFAKASVPLSAIKGSVLLDGAGYDVPKQMAANPNGPLIGSMYVAAFSKDKETQLRLSPITYAAAPNASNWLLLHDAKRPDSGEQSRALASALNRAGAVTTVTPVLDSSHMKINNDLGVDGSFMTEQVDTFVKRVL
jgi:arylformamidase